ncbi:hypothetical protein ACVQ8P_02005 [Dellaglioa sp. BT-FLS60]
MKKLKVGTLLITTLMALIFIGKSVSANGDYDSAIKKAPHGITMENIFTPGTGSASGFTNNSSVVTLDEAGNVVDAGSESAAKSVVKITDATKNQLASIWSTPRNEFNLNQSSTTSMWMYFGNQSLPGNSDPGDGMALVLQNDRERDKGIGAISGGGESLGVWGIDTGGKDIQNSAIKNSWALEFDTHANKTNSKGSGFDIDGASGDHLASGYPAEPETYKYTQGSTIFTHYNKMIHNGVIDKGSNSWLSNGEWHHVTLKYVSNSPTEPGSMTYTIDDKNPTTDAKQTGSSAMVAIDKTKFNAADGLVLWGFTGATGAKFETNLAMFEQVPNLVSAKATQKVIDNTQKEKDVTNGGYVAGGDALNFQTTLDYKGGLQDWHSIEADLKVPNDISLKSGTITYYDANGDATGVGETFNPTSSLDVIKKKLSHSLTEKSPRAVISMFGTANKVAKDTVVTSAASEFNGTNAIVSSTDASFTIGATTTLAISGLNEPSVDQGADALVTGTLTSSNEATTSNAVTFYSTINGKAIAKNPTITLTSATGKFEDNVPAADLKHGNNKYTVYAVDQYGDKSEVAETTIKVNSKPVFTLTDEGQTVDAPYTLKYQVQDDSSSIKTYYQEGKDTPVLMDTFDNTKINTLISGTYALPSTLSVGKHVLSVYATDSDDVPLTSDVKKITVVVSGKIEITTVGNLDFGLQKIPAQTTVLSRPTDFSVDLETSLPGTWKLTASATDLTSDSNTIKGAIVYRDKSGDTLQTLDSTGIEIASGASSQTMTTKSWTKDAGVLIKADPSQVHKDSYTAEVKWTLSHTPAS